MLATLGMLAHVRSVARLLALAVLAVPLSGLAVAVDAALPRAAAAVPPEGPVEGHIGGCTDQGFPESKGRLSLRNGPAGGANANAEFAGVLKPDNTLDISDLDPTDDVKVAAVMLKGPNGYHYVFRGTPYLDGADLRGLYAPWDADGSPDADGTYPRPNHWLLCAQQADEPVQPPPPPATESGLEVKILEPVCDGNVPYLRYELTATGFDPSEVTLTWVNPGSGGSAGEDGNDVVYEGLPLSGRVPWPGAEVAADGTPLDWPGWTQVDGQWVEGDEFDWVRPEVELVFGANPTVTTSAAYPASAPDCDPNPPPSPPSESSLEVSVLEPVCDDKAPYLRYAVQAHGFDPSELTLTWVNPGSDGAAGENGDDVVYEGLPLSGRVPWAGAEVAPDGTATDWPGWSLVDGEWVEGDEFDWVRQEVELIFDVNPAVTVTATYPSSSPDCASPPSVPTLPATGAAQSAVLTLAGSGLLASGAGLVGLGRWFGRLRS